jgi:hypothetical protein
VVVCWFLHRDKISAVITLRVCYRASVTASLGIGETNYALAFPSRDSQAGVNANVASRVFPEPADLVATG